MADDRKQVLVELDNEIRMMRTTMDLYFQGIEREPPNPALEKLKKKVQRLRGEAGRWATSDKFRLNTLAQKLSTFSQMWERELTAMENGTSRRQKAKLNRKKKNEVQREMLEKEAREASAALGQAQREAGEVEGVPQKSAAARRRPAASGADMSDEKIRRLYNVYMQAKKRTGEGSNLSYDKLASQIRRQIPQIKAKHKCGSVDFKVVLKNGKAMLKAVPK
ncbi:MAG: hypothetical protein GY822_08895 [Deltaproteobacteria bacterium]|nr:hypothetical protein [Deltaproteobacteria bacterium]